MNKKKIVVLCWNMIIFNAKNSITSKLTEPNVHVCVPCKTMLSIFYICMKTFPCFSFSVLVQSEDMASKKILHTDLICTHTPRHWVDSSIFQSMQACMLSNGEQRWALLSTSPTLGNLQIQADSGSLPPSLFLALISQEGSHVNRKRHHAVQLCMWVYVCTV